MPDWSYRPVFRPILFRLPPEPARDLTLSAMGTLARLPLGPQVIDFLGHMAPPSALGRSVCGITFPGPVGLGAGLDVGAVALSALARFGFGYLEAGPVTLAPVRPAGHDRSPIERCTVEGTIRYSDLPVNDGLAVLAGRLARMGPLPVPLGIRLAHRPGAGAAEAAAERRQLVEGLARFAAFFTLDTRGGADDSWTPAEWSEHLAVVLAALRDRSPSAPLLLCLAPDLDEQTADRRSEEAVELGLGGVVVAGGIAAPPAGRLVGPPTREQSRQMVRAIHDRWGDRLAIVGSGGVHQPEDALALLEAGAALVQLHSGLVYAGPGLPKRINEAVAYFGAADVTARVEPDASREGVEATRSRIGAGWAWAALLGVGMILGGLLAWIVAATRVVLPYDEAFVGLSRAELAAVNGRLLSFMAHDRITLAGTMVSIGTLYTGLALCGLRRGLHWAGKALLLSGVAGFASFFLFLGFGYFDPLHALVTLVLFPFFLLSLRDRPMRGRQDQGAPAVAEAVGAMPNLRNDRRWLLGVWGQLLFVIIGAGLTIAGCTLALIGISSVFVPEDLAFLRTTAAELGAANARLVPLIAHDRAGLGGALVSNGVAVLLSALWGYRQGARWLWWTLLIAGGAGFVAALGTHAAVGYVDTWHLSPAYLAVLLYLLGLVLSRPFLCRADPLPQGPPANR